MNSNAVIYPEDADQSTASLYSPLQPDELLTTQYLDTIRAKAELGPEKNLLLAVLEDALTCYQKNIRAKSNKGRAAFEEAEKWLLDDAEDHLFSFRIVCDTLGLNPDWLRRGLMEWKKDRKSYQDAA